MGQVRGRRVAARDFDVARVRGLYPTLSVGTAFLDGPMSALQPESVIRAIIATLRSAPAQPGANSARSRRTATAVQSARRAFADLVGGTPESVVFGTSLASVQLQFAEIVAADLRLGDELVLSRADSDALLMPWLRSARGPGAVIHWAEVDLETGQLPTWQYDELIGPRTRLVTVPLANPATGTVPDVRAIADLAHRHGALVLVDAGAAAPHVPIDLAALGADLSRCPRRRSAARRSRRWSRGPACCWNWTGGCTRPLRTTSNSRRCRSNCSTEPRRLSTTSPTSTTRRSAAAATGWSPP